MLCGFIEKDYSASYKELKREEIEEFCLCGQYFSINSDNEYYIFIDNEIYTEENIDKIAPILMKINKELLLKSR